MRNPILKIRPGARMRVLQICAGFGFMGVIAGAVLLVAGEFVAFLKIPGIALVLLGVGLLAATQASRRSLLRHIAEIKKHGDVALRQKIFQDKPYEYRVLSKDALPDVDLYFYDNTQKLLANLGFACLGDLENLTLTKTFPDRRTFSRAMRCAEGVISLDMYFSKRPTPNGPDSYRMHFRSELSNGYFITTNNTGGNTTNVNQDERSLALFLPGKALPEEMLRIHRETLALQRILKPDLPFVQIRSIDDYIHQSHRLDSIIARRQQEQNFQKADPKVVSAKRILDQQKRLWASGPHEVRMATLAEFPNLDHSFYEGFKNSAEAKGWRHLADKEDMTLSRVFPHMRTLLRLMGSPDGKAIGAAFHMRTPEKQHRVIEFDTEFSDGTFTTSTTAREQFTHPVEIDARHFPDGTSFDDLLTAHEQRVAEKLLGNPQVTIVRINNFAEYRASADRQHEIKSRFKIAKGLFNEEDMRKLRGRALTPHEAAVMNEIEKLKAAQ